MTVADTMDTLALEIVKSMLKLRGCYLVAVKRSAHVFYWILFYFLDISFFLRYSRFCLPDIYESEIPESATSRPLGMTLVPGNHVVKCFLQSEK